MSKVLVVIDKYGTTVYGANGIETAAIELLSERVESGYWYDDDTEPSLILAGGSGEMALQWLLYRAREGYEYEWVEVQELR